MHLTSAIKQMFHVYSKYYPFMLLIQIAWILIKLGQCRITYLGGTQLKWIILQSSTHLPIKF